MENKIETRCPSTDCPVRKVCANFSQDSDKFNLVEYEFHLPTEIDEQPFECEGYEDKKYDEFYK